MHALFKSTAPLLSAVCLALAGCASTQPVPYAGLASSSQLRPNTNDQTGRIPYNYITQANLRDYRNIIVDPVVVYRGQDSQFEEVTEADKAALAAYMQSEFEAKLRGRFNLTRDVGRDTLRLKLTLTGAKSSTRFLSTASRFDLAGGPYNAVQAVRGKEGAFTGSVMYAVELYDASTNQLLNAYVTKQYPGPYNLGASLGLMDASRAGVRSGAEALLAQLQ
ncbi:putative lipoprotein YmbA [Duganella sp. 1411]|uniref:DUF3313 domain-containing protein n=1 Tax=Duganella sp. 1411 TaxID=2806572 RepID=UPI001AE24F6C|nr:DUF3313 domain-containing protein [Duganella sp. 1411]MBP1203513.1 putative lipoprotein YmbA [Duganella sp. 1411]